VTLRELYSGVGQGESPIVIWHGNVWFWLQSIGCADLLHSCHSLLIPHGRNIEKSGIRSYKVGSSDSMRLGQGSESVKVKIEARV